MNEPLATLAKRIHERFPRLDIRTDQCETIRIYAEGVLVGVNQRDDKFIAQFISLEGDLDFETTLLKTLSSTDLNGFEESLLRDLVDLTPHR